eukprot:TRINITY_DN29785_c0_g1_i1.p1 TRINITY_DN29785_c0_g1~~TRINITY_DN29785_c0_g1_i1.p1  ORF type:complete len:521 (+),score=137.97 TRINITY_DN29785_c0_g1_i1:89-1651(+)
MSALAREVVDDVLAFWRREAEDEEPLKSRAPAAKAALPKRQKWNGVATAGEIEHALRQYDAAKPVRGADLAIACTLLVSALAGSGTRAAADSDAAVQRIRRFIERRIARPAVERTIVGRHAVTLYVAFKQLGWFDSQESDGGAARAVLTRLTSPVRARELLPSDYVKLLTTHVKMRARAEAVGLLCNPWRGGCWEPMHLANICYAHAALLLGRSFPPAAGGAAPPAATAAPREPPPEPMDELDPRSAALRHDAAPGLPRAIETEVCRVGMGAASTDSADVTQLLWAVSKLQIPPQSAVYTTIMERLAREWVADKDVVKVLWALSQARVDAPGVFAFALPYAQRATAVDYSQLVGAYARVRALRPELFKEYPPQAILKSCNDEQLARIVWAYGKASEKAHVQQLLTLVHPKRTSRKAQAGMAVTFLQNFPSFENGRACYVKWPQFLRELKTDALPGEQLARLASAAHHGGNTMIIGRVAQTLKETKALDKCTRTELLSFKAVYPKPPLSDTIARLLRRTRR